MDYFIWLINIIDTNKVDSRIMYCLFNIPFEYYNERDESRVEDAISLRKKFYDEQDSIPFETISFLEDSEITVLEVLIALATRLDNQILGDVDGGKQLFETMISNLGITNNMNHGQILDIIFNWLNGNYDEHGVGSIFIVDNPKRPMNEVDLWYQAMYYITENYI